MIYIFPLLLLLAYRYSPTQFVNYSNSVLGKLLAISAIFMYLNNDYLYGVLACLLIILYYQSDFFENMTTMEAMSSIEKQQGSSCVCSSKNKDKENDSDKNYKKSAESVSYIGNKYDSEMKRSTSLSKADLKGLEGFQQYGVFEKTEDYDKESSANACALCENTTDGTDGKCEMCNIVKDVIPMDNRFMDEEFLRIQRISGREMNGPQTNGPETSSPE